MTTNHLTASINIIAPYGGHLVDLVVDGREKRRELLSETKALPSVQLSSRAICDLELLATGAFSHWTGLWARRIIALLLKACGWRIECYSRFRSRFPLISGRTFGKAFASLCATYRTVSSR